MLAISLTVACSRYIYNGVILHAHPVRGESHNQRNTTGVVATEEIETCFLTTVVIYHKNVTLGESTEHFTTNDGFKVTAHAKINRPTVCK